MQNYTDAELRSMRGDDGQLTPAAQREMSFRWQEPAIPKGQPMSQGFLDWQALKMMPRIVAAIRCADEFGSNQIQYAAIRAIREFTPCLADMSDIQITNESTKMIASYIHNGWLDAVKYKLELLKNDQ